MEFGGRIPSPQVGFNNVKLDLGSFISDFLGPIAEKINDAIKPFDPVLDALQTRIPVLSDLMGRDYTLLDLAATFGKVDRRFVDAVLQVRGLIADIAAASAAGEEYPHRHRLDRGLRKRGDEEGCDGIDRSIGTWHLHEEYLGSRWRYGGNQERDEQGLKCVGWRLRLPDPEAGKRLQAPDGAGCHALHLRHSAPRGVDVDVHEVQHLRTARGDFRRQDLGLADLAVGFDTKGLNQFKTSGDPLDILDGFYVSDRANPDGTGADVPEAGFMGRIDIGGAVNLAIVEAGINGFFQITANLDLNDPNDDGKIRGSEIISLLKYQAPDGNYYGPLNLGSITLKGEVGARAYVDIWAFGWSTVWEYEFFRATIFEKTFTAPRPQPELAKVDGDGVLRLNAGTGANGRVFGSTSRRG